MSSRICSTGGRREVERNSVPRSQVCWITVIIMVMVRMENISMVMLVVIMFIVVIIPPGAVPAASGAPVVASLPPVPQLRRLRADELLRSSSRVCWSPTLTCIGLLDRAEGVRRRARHACVLHLDFSMDASITHYLQVAPIYLKLGYTCFSFLSCWPL